MLHTFLMTLQEWTSFEARREDRPTIGWALQRTIERMRGKKKPVWHASCRR